MKTHRLLLLLLTACAAPAAAPLPPGSPQAQKLQPIVLPAGNASCQQLLEAVSEAPLGPQPENQTEGALVQALGACEAAIVPRLSPVDREELMRGRPLYSVSFNHVPNEELWSYAGLLHRFVLATEMRRTLHFGPVLARLFALRSMSGTCSLGPREAALFLTLTPKAFGGDPARGERYFAAATCQNDQRLAAEIARLR